LENESVKKVRAASGFAIGGVAPVALVLELPTRDRREPQALRDGLCGDRHPNCVFPLSGPEHKRLTGGIVPYAVAEKA